MKIILVFLSLGLIFNFISAFEANKTSNIYDTTSYLQGLAHQQHGQLNNTNIISHVVTNSHNEIDHLTSSHLEGGPYQQEQPDIHNANSVHDQADEINNKNSRLNQQNRSRLRGGKSQPEHPLQNTTGDQHQHNPFDNQLIHPKFRPIFQHHRHDNDQAPLLGTSAVITNSDISSDRQLLADSRTIEDTTKSFSLLQIFTGAQTPRRISFADYYFQRQLKAFFGHHHDKFPSRTRSYIRTGLRR